MHVTRSDSRAESAPLSHERGSLLISRTGSLQNERMKLVLFRLWGNKIKGRLTSFLSRTRCVDNREVGEADVAQPVAAVRAGPLGDGVAAVVQAHHLEAAVVVAATAVVLVPRKKNCKTLKKRFFFAILT